MNGGYDFNNTCEARRVGVVAWCNKVGVIKILVLSSRLPARRSRSENMLVFVEYYRGSEDA